MSREGTMPNTPLPAAHTQTHMHAFCIPCAVIPYYFVNSLLLKYLIIYVCISIYRSVYLYL